MCIQMFCKNESIWDRDFTYNFKFHIAIKLVFCTKMVDAIRTIYVCIQINAWHVTWCYVICVYVIIMRYDYVFRTLIITDTIWKWQNTK